MINGISRLATNQDLVDRVISIELPKITGKHRRTDKELESEFQRMGPGIFGALLNALVSSLDELSTLETQSRPRMADFYELGVALCRTQGWESFGKTYKRNLDRSRQHAMEASPVVMAVVDYLRSNDHFEGTYQTLLARLEAPHGSRSWPSTAKGLATILRSQEDALNSCGISVYRYEQRSSGGFKIRLELAKEK